MVNYGTWCSRGAVLITVLMLLSFAAALPVESEEISGNDLGTADMAESSPWDALDADALRKVLMQIEADERMAFAPRVARSWSPLQRGWSAGGPRAYSRAASQWRTDKRQVRFRQCYFNPISCFRK